MAYFSGGYVSLRKCIRDPQTINVQIVNPQIDRISMQIVVIHQPKSLKNMQILHEKPPKVELRCLAYELLVGGWTNPIEKYVR